MSRTLLLPNAASSFSGACVPGSEGKPVWLTLVTVGACGMVRLHPGSASTAGKQLIALVASPLTTVGPHLVGAFTTGVYVEGPSGTGASAFVALATRTAS